MAEYFLNKLKTLCEKEKLLVTSNFSFSVFSKDLYCRHVKTRACLRKGKGTGLVNLEKNVFPPRIRISYPTHPQRLVLEVSRTFFVRNILPLSIVLTVMWEGSQWLGKNTVREVPIKIKHE